MLNSAFELSEQLKQTGYVKKPITGRAGSNITIVNPDSSVMSQSLGSWEGDDFIYQEKFTLCRFNCH